jgi:hypothetical protein
MNDRYLYRGVNPKMHADTGGTLTPKRIGEPFSREVYYGEKVYYGGGAVFGKTERNAVLMHQQNSNEYQTSGVSTTPIYENAVKYATNKGKYTSGIIYKIDTALLSQYDVKAYKVDEHVHIPAIPEDEEIILVAKDFGPLPKEIVIEVIDV